MAVGLTREPGDDNQEFRYAAYRHYIFWQYGSLGQGNWLVIPSCCVWAIRDHCPDATSGKQHYKMFLSLSFFLVYYSFVNYYICKTTTTKRWKNCTHTFSLLIFMNKCFPDWIMNKQKFMLHITGSTISQYFGKTTSTDIIPILQEYHRDDYSFWLQ